MNGELSYGRKGFALRCGFRIPLLLYDIFIASGTEDVFSLGGDFFMQKRKANSVYLKRLASLAMLSAVSIICGKYLAFNAGPFLRFSFENMPIIFAGIVFGAIPAMAVGVISDLLGSVMVGYGIIPLIAVGAGATGLVSGLASKLFKRLRMNKTLSIALSAVLAHTAGSVIIKSIALYISGFNMGLAPLPFVLWRVLNYAIIAPVEIFLLNVLLKNKGINKLLMDMTLKENKFHSFANSFQAVTVPGLERISALLSKLGNPEDKLRFVHIAGTNGKGSVSANMACIFEEAGFKTGKFISPNLLRVNERISVNGTDISDVDMNQILSEIEPYAKEVEKEQGIAPTQFEIWCALAFVYFERQACDIVVLEVGLGGEFDATNVIKSNEIQIITRLGMDHTAYLGTTLSTVAAAKCGIIKASSKTKALVTVAQDEEAMSVIREKCAKLDTELIVASPVPVSKDGVYENFSVDGVSFKTGIPGFHQIENASLAILAAKKLGISVDIIKRGVLRAKNPARFEIIRENPYVIYDGGHNENGITALNFTLKRYFGDAPKTVIFACMKDKAIDKSLELLSEGNTEFIFTTVKDNPRAMSASELKKTAERFGFMGLAFEEIGDAYREALSRGKLTVICGSLYLYKDFKEFYEKEL